MRRGFPILLALLAATSLAAAAADHAKLARSLADTEREFAKITAASNIRDGFLAYFAEDCISFSPDPGLAVPRLKAEQPDDSIILEWHPVVTGVSRAGDLGYNTGPVIITERKTGKRLGRSYFMSMWRRQGDGKWKVVLDIGARVPETHAPPAWAMAALSPYVAGAGATTSPEAITAVEEHFRATVGEKGLLAAYAAVLDRNEVRIHRRLHEPMVTRAAVNDYLRSQQERGVLTWKVTGAQVAKSSDLGYSYGTYAVAPAGGTPTEEGSYTHVWKRAADGGWKLVLDVTAPFPPKQQQ